MSRTTPPPDLIRETLTRSQTDPAWFCRVILGYNLTDYQAAIITALVTEKRVAVKSCNGAGKTLLAALAALWGLTTHYNARVVTTAPTDRQVQGLLWAEISRAWKRAHERWPGLLPGRLYEIPRLQITKSWYAIGFSTNDPNAMQGHHAPFVLIIMDEAGGNKGGVAAPMWEPIDGNLTGADCHFLPIGNPTDPTSPFYTECKNPATRVYSISSFDTPNFTTFGITEADMLAGEATWRAKLTGPLPRPELTTPDAVWDALRKYGRESTYWSARVLGQFPEQGTDTLLWMRWVDEAQQRHELIEGDTAATKVTLGCDIAAGGDNETVLSAFAWYGDSIPRQLFLRPNSLADTTVTAELILAAALELHTAHPDATISVRIDYDGVGHAVYDYVAKQARVRGYGWLELVTMRNGATASDPDTYFNTRSQWWWAVREYFEANRIAILSDDLQTSQLTSIKWRENAARRVIQVEPKEEAKRRGVASPDRGDALMYALAPVGGAPGVLFAGKRADVPAHLLRRRR